MSKWVAFLDLLGTRNKLNLSTKAAKDHFTLFHAAVKKLGNALDKDDKCYVLSDSAFFEINNLSIFFCEMQAFRQSLFEQAVFFKCALATGSLEAVRITDSHVDTAQDGRVEGFSFEGDAAAKSYVAHEKFHGIGTYINPTHFTEIAADAQKLLVHSYHTVLDRRGKLMPVRSFLT